MGSATVFSKIFESFPRPPCADLLGWEMLEEDPDNRRVRLRFQGRPEFLNPAGTIQGGLLAAMLDDTMGPAVVVASRGEHYAPTISLNVSFLAPAKVGPLYGEARVVQMGKTVVFMEGELTDADGVVVARATANARLIALNKLPA
ncbi:MAG TPA: PaaI family thioesterase [Caulobacteraceae bacterium]|jgi:uncharacterized protein (TIGR00369 family)